MIQRYSSINATSVFVLPTHNQGKMNVKTVSDRRISCALRLPQNPSLNQAGPILDYTCHCFTYLPMEVSGRDVAGLEPDMAVVRSITWPLIGRTPVPDRWNPVSDRPELK